MERISNLLFGGIGPSILLGLALLLPGCSGGDDDDSSPGDDDTEMGDDDTSVDETPADTIEAQLVVSTSDYSNGYLTTLSLDSMNVTPDRFEVGGDTSVVAHDGLLYLLVSSFDSENYVSVRDPASDFEEIQQIPLGVGTTPRDLVIAGNSGYVSLYAGGGVLVFDVATGAVLRTIDLSSYADPDGDPNASDLELDGTTLYVALQRVNYLDEFFAPTAPGMIVPIDTTMNIPGQAISVHGTNISTVHVDDEHDIWVASFGTYDSEDGGIERIEHESLTSTGFLITEADLGVTYFDEGFVTVGQTGYLNANGSLTAFSLEDDSLIGAVSAADGIVLTHLAAEASLGLLALSDIDGQVWLMDADASALLNSGGLELGSFSAYRMTFLLP